MTAQQAGNSLCWLWHEMLLTNPHKYWGVLMLKVGLFNNFVFETILQPNFSINIAIVLSVDHANVFIMPLFPSSTLFVFSQLLKTAWGFFDSLVVLPQFYLEDDIRSAHVRRCKANRNNERKNKETKGWKEKKGRTTERLCSANPLRENVRLYMLQLVV